MHPAVLECARRRRRPIAERGIDRQGVRRAAAGHATASDAMARSCRISSRRRSRRTSTRAPIEFLDALPRTETGKLQRFVLRDARREETMDVLQPPGWPRPHGYANGRRRRGRQVFVAGQIGWDATGALADASWPLRCARRSRTCSPCVAEAGGGPEHVDPASPGSSSTRPTTLARAARDRCGLPRGHGRGLPAMSLYEVGLLEPGALVEIEVTAVVPE